MKSQIYNNTKGYFKFKNTAVFIVLLFGIHFSILAQVSTPQPGDPKTTIEELTPAERQEKYINHLTKELNLNTDQQVMVAKILAEKSEKAEKLKAEKEARQISGKRWTQQEKKALKTKLKAEKADTEAQMKAILSSDQYAKWITLREDKKEKFKERRREKRAL
ncbi:hypothetical protein [Flavobacterium adhaerens]|uniref:hypothetical protein n=1 Tax=Flavobacterium adhaerens TaxID=3149043 RepID=UPI0032B50409